MYREKFYDVVVIGSGPAGIGAAIAAARGEARTLIIEKESTLGGMMTGGLVTGFHGMRSHKGFQEKGEGAYIPVAKHTPILTKGIAMELCNRLIEENGAYAEKCPSYAKKIPLRDEPERDRFVYWDSRPLERRNSRATS